MSSTVASTENNFSSFTDFFAHNNNDNDNDNNSWASFDEEPKFKSLAPSSLYVSHHNHNHNDNDNDNDANTVVVSPSSFFLTTPHSFSPSIFLDSPLFNKFPSPTIGALGNEKLKWSVSNEIQQVTKVEQVTNNNFSFHALNIPTEGWSFDAPNKQTDMNYVNREVPGSKPDLIPNPISTAQNDLKIQKNYQNASECVQPFVQMNRAQKRAEDGYCWRKYGQKQVKGSENPRSYYKCSYPNCPTKKKVEKSPQGNVTEIVYKGSHNHPKPQPGKRSSLSVQNNAVFDTSSNNNAQNEYSSFTPETSSVSLDIEDDEFDQTSNMSRSGKDDEYQHDAKRWKGENEGEVMSGYDSKTVREPRVIVQTTSEIDILDDGFRWRKYGQKVVKGNPNPRSYYKCTSLGCPVRKHIERACHDNRAVITTYEGKHNHDIPAARGSSYNNVTIPIRPSAITTQPNQLTRMNPASRPEAQQPFTLQMIQGTASFDFSGFGNGAKDEPMDNSFFDSFLV